MANRLLLIVMLLVSGGAFAMGETYCSNQDGSIRRVEYEIWGQNEVRWFLNAEEVPADKVYMDEDTKIILQRQVRNNQLNSATLLEQYAVLAVAEGFFNDYVICESWQNSLVD